ncbi:MAG: FkbM family methyltransferase [Clostridia bacterium]|nr:FkbM family methyltransferase [Clostridia bacterium]
MPYKRYKLPEYPTKSDMWEKIASDSRPIAVYGMGNGADKLFSHLEKYGAHVSEVFASDGFVRGHSFRGFKVKSLSDIASEYEDFLILLSFASNREEVIEMLKKINSEHTMLVPDMPVAGEEYFDKDFYNNNYENIIKAYESLADEDSKNAFAAIINYKLFGDAEYLLNCYSDTSEIYKLIGSDIRCAVDAGAYNGDTVREMLSYFSKLEKVYAIEPDKRNYKKLSRYVEENLLSEKVLSYNAAVWSEDSSGEFKGSGNRNSSVASTASYEVRAEEIPLVKIDSAVNEKVDYIKYDVEGAEMEALIGSFGTIEKYRPTLLISAYHRSEDIFSLINYMREKHPYYSLYIRRTMCFPAWEIAIIAIPNKSNE